MKFGSSAWAVRHPPAAAWSSSSRRVRRLVRDRLLEEATGTVVHRAGGEVGPSLAGVDEEVVVAAAELLAAMDPHRLDVGTQGARQLADDPGVPAGVRQRVELGELRVHDHLDRVAVAEGHVDYVRVDDGYRPWALIWLCLVTALANSRMMSVATALNLAGGTMVVWLATGCGWRRGCR
jgi:hypothetical protein